MFPLFRSDAALEVYMTAYCRHTTKHKSCARYQLATSGNPPDIDLLPDGTRLPAGWIKPSDSDVAG